MLSSMAYSEVAAVIPLLLKPGISLVLQVFVRAMRKMRQEGEEGEEAEVQEKLTSTSAHAIHIHSRRIPKP